MSAAESRTSSLEETLLVPRREIQERMNRHRAQMDADYLGLHPSAPQGLGLLWSLAKNVSGNFLQNGDVSGWYGPLFRWLCAAGLTRAVAHFMPRKRHPFLSRLLSYLPRSLVRI